MMRFLSPLLHKIWQPVPLMDLSDKGFDPTAREEPIDPIARDLEAAVAANAETTTREVATFDHLIQASIANLFERMGVRDGHGG